MKTPVNESSHARINCRVSASIKRRAEETALAEKAGKVLSHLGAIRLSGRDFRRFVKAMNRPPRPTAKLRKAASAYKRLRAERPESNW